MSIPQARKAGLPLMNLVRFKGIPILKQLHLEEKLLRTSSNNWCIINDRVVGGGILYLCPSSASLTEEWKPSELLELGSVLQDQVPVIKRFTGGGTAVVDPGTIFVTLICNREDVPDVQPYPRSIMHWSGLLYNEALKGIDGFQLRENDYIFGNHKFGGNAQSITRKRWIHHTSFLWDFETKNMAYLKQPARAPEYRLARSHTDFVCRMNDYMPRSVFIHRTVKAIESHFLAKPVDLDVDTAVHDAEFVHSTRLLMNNELEEAFSIST